MLKIALGIIGLAIGGWAGFWIVGLGADALISASEPPLEPGAGFGSLVAAALIGTPIGGLIGLSLGVVGANRIARKRS